MNNSVIVSLRDIVVEFDGQRILDGLNLDIHDKEFVTLLGSSGCGKTTTLRLIAGFLEPTSGKVLLKGEDITGVPPYKRPVNTVFQKYALFPHLNVFENVAFGLRLKKMDEETIRRKVRDMLEVVGLKGFERRSIGQMSGGQQQRVAIARSLVNEPEILLLDEPLGALDLKLRKEMQLELKRLQREMNITFIYVTHDQEEALTMSDTVVVMNGGKVQQIGTPEDIYNEPKNAFVADFIGDSVKWFKENDNCQLLYADTELLGVQPPMFIEVEITETDPGFKGDTVQGGTKPATIETGAVIQVPMYLNQGEVIKVDTRDGKFVSRV